MAESLVPVLFFMENEIWIPVPGFNGKYEASSFGKIRSVYGVSKLGKRRTTGTILKPSINYRGYYAVKLSGRTYKIHRLVALSFHENPGNKPQVNHKDLNQLNNRADNLEWATAKENTNHAQVNGRRPISKPCMPVGEYPRRFKKVKNMESGEVYDSVEALSSLAGMKPKELRRRLSGERPNNTAYEYLEESYSYVYAGK